MEEDDYRIQYCIIITDKEYKMFLYYLNNIQVN